jgi:hypothetical protein
MRDMPVPQQLLEHDRGLNLESDTLVVMVPARLVVAVIALATDPERLPLLMLDRHRHRLDRIHRLAVRPLKNVPDHDHARLFDYPPRWVPFRQTGLGIAHPRRG